MSVRKRCCICGTVITDAFHVCSGCEAEWGLSGPVDTWPEWAQELRRSEDRERKHQARHAPHTDQYLDEWRRLGSEIQNPMCPEGMVAFGSDGALVADPGPGAEARGWVLREIRR